MTVRDLLVKAFKSINVLGAGESMDAEEASDALDILNGIIEQANIDKLMGPYETSLVIPMVANQLSYTIGPVAYSPNVVAPRPVEILSGFSRRSSIDIPLGVGSKQDYDRIRLKSNTIAGWEYFVYYEASYPLGIVYVYPMPKDTLTSVYLAVTANLSTFASLDTTVDLPPGYRMWLQYKTAQRLAPEYGATLTRDMLTNLIEAEAALKRNNIKPMPAADTSLGLNSTGGGYNVLSDGPR